MTPAIVFVEADMLIAGSASKTGASFALLQLCELNVIYGIACEQVITECRRNLKQKLPEALKPFENIITNTVKVSQNPNQKDCKEHNQMAHEKDLPILTSALQNQAKYLVTFNTKHYFPRPSTSIQILQPKDILHKIRTILSEI